jgi:hypothetical protein
LTTVTKGLHASEANDSLKETKEVGKLASNLLAQLWKCKTVINSNIYTVDSEVSGTILDDHIARSESGDTEYCPSDDVMSDGAFSPMYRYARIQHFKRQYLEIYKHT